MMFEFSYSLEELEKRTPAYFRQEALESSDVTTKREAIRILRSLGREDMHAVAMLKEILRLTNQD